MFAVQSVLMASHTCMAGISRDLAGILVLTTHG